MAHNKTYAQHRRTSRKQHFAQLSKYVAMLQGRQNVLGNVLSRGFFGRFKWLLFGR